MAFAGGRTQNPRWATRCGFHIQSSSPFVLRWPGAMCGVSDNRAAQMSLTLALSRKSCTLTYLATLGGPPVKEWARRRKRSGSLCFGRDDGKSRCAAEPSPTCRKATGLLSRENNGRGSREAGNKSRGTWHPNSGDLGSRFLRCAQDDAKKVLTGRSPHLFLSSGAGVTPAQGSMKPTVGFT